jgi:protein phosphatase
VTDNPIEGRTPAIDAPLNAIPIEASPIPLEQKSKNWDGCLEQAALSDTGMRRTSNQDSWAIQLAGTDDEWERRGHLFLVADGMGAHAAGELASKLSADIIPLTYQKLDDPLISALRKSVEDANQKIHSRGQADPEFHGMGTTTSVLVLGPSGAVAAHVGDSRVYRLRGDQMQQLTFDHSLVWEMMAGPEPHPKEVPLFIPRNIITRSLGPSPEVQVDVEGPFGVETGDAYLLCSDGLCGQLTDEEMGSILRSLPPSEAARALVDVANLRGGPDNITAVIAKVNGPPLAGAYRPDEGEHDDSHGSTDDGPAWLVPAIAGAALAALVAVGSFVYHWFALAALAAATAILLVAIILRRPVPPPRRESPLAPKRNVRSPYRTANAQATQTWIEELARFAEQLKEAAKEENWQIDWPRFDDLRRTADEAAAAHHRDAAVTAYCRTISFVMGQLRNQQINRPLSSSDNESVR